MGSRAKQHKIVSLPSAVFIDLSHAWEDSEIHKVKDIVGTAGNFEKKMEMLFVWWTSFSIKKSLHFDNWGKMEKFEYK